VPVITALHELGKGQLLTKRFEKDSFYLSVNYFGKREIIK
jgi:hypothetical protein